MSGIGFYEKPGRNQVGCLVFSLDKVFSPESPSVATLSSPLFIERSCSLGTSWVLSFQPVLPPDYRPRFYPPDGSWGRRLMQSAALGVVFSNLLASFG